MPEPNLSPHAGQPLATAGAPLEAARAAVILVHGRGARAAGMIDLAQHVFDERVAYLAPQAAGASWYPHSFLAPLAMNEPGLSSGLAVLAALVARAKDAGVPAGRIVLLGFSQGACLALEFAARNPRRYGGVAALSGGLIGSADLPGTVPPDDKAFGYAGSLEGTPVLLGCSDRDAHIPLARVHRSAEVMRGLGAEVDARIYPGMGHTINAEEIDLVAAMIGSVLQGASD
ncbi:MAG: dienelactone hydrolase family protein [Rhodothermales bacterium]